MGANPSRQGLRAKTLSGLRWSLTSTGLSTAVQIVHMMIMARLLSPADFGLVALAMAFLKFGTYFAQLGVGQALMQRLTLNDREIRTAFTTSILLGVLLATVFYFAAPFAQSIVDAPEVVPVIQMLALSMVIAGPGTTAISLLKRELRFRGLAMIEVGSYVIGYVFVGITLAVLGFGVWSLVFAALGQALLQTLAAYAMTRHASRPLLGWTDIKTLYGYGGKYSVTQFLSAAQHALITSAVGHVAGVSALGLFDRARMLVKLPFQKIESTITKVLFPAMSRVQTDTQTLAKLFLLQKSLVAAVFLPVLSGMAVSADILVTVLLGPQWFEAVSMVPLIAIAVGIVLLGHFSRVIADVKALMNQRLIIEFSRLILLGFGLLIGSRYGLHGLLFGMIAAEAIAYLAYACLMRKHLLVSWIDLIHAVAPGAFATAVVSAGLIASKTIIGESTIPGFFALVIQIFVGGSLLSALWLSPVFSSLRNEVLALESNSKDGNKRHTGPSRGAFWRLLFGSR